MSERDELEDDPAARMPDGLDDDAPPEIPDLTEDEERPAEPPRSSAPPAEQAEQPPPKPAGRRSSPNLRVERDLRAPPRKSGSERPRISVIPLPRDLESSRTGGPSSRADDGPGSIPAAPRPPRVDRPGDKSKKTPTSVLPHRIISVGGGDTPRSQPPPAPTSWRPVHRSSAPPPTGAGAADVNERRASSDAPPRAEKATSDAPSPPEESISDAPPERSGGAPEIEVQDDPQPGPEQLDPAMVRVAPPSPPPEIVVEQLGHIDELELPDDIDLPPPRPPMKSKPPPAPSSREGGGEADATVEAVEETIDAAEAPELEIEIDTGDDEEPGAAPLEAIEEPAVEEVAPDSVEELVTEPEAAPEDLDRALEAEAEAKKSAPPLKKPKKRPPPAPSDRLVAAALEPGDFEPAEPTKKKRVRPWWEELFTEDFAPGMIPLSKTQLAREADFIEESLGVARGGVVLDLCCGVGQQAVELSARGYGIVGLDLSVSQLAVAGEHAQERGQKINFMQGDMREMSFEEMFDGVYCWNTSFGYFEEEKNVTVLQNVFKALKSGGNFLLDVVNRDFVAEQQPSSVWFEGDACVCMDDMSVDFITSRLRVKRTMMLDDGRTKECYYSIRIYSLHELGKLLHGLGFRVIEASGHPAMPGAFFGATSPRVIILAQKP